MEKFIITTTPNIEGYQIKAYLGAINVNIVIGTNFFSDFAASFTDVFGGNSNTYQQKMDSMYESAKKELENKAKRLGGNAIIGFKTDFDEISGKGKSMFMLSATGTACKIHNEQEELFDETNTHTIDVGYLKQELDHRLLMEKLDRYISADNISDSDWLYMSEHPKKEFVKKLIDTFFYTMSSDDRFKFEEIIKLINYKDASEIVYEKYRDMPEGESGNVDTMYCNIISDIIHNAMLFNPLDTLSLIESSPSKAVEVIDSDKPWYDTNDLKAMKEILSKIESLPDVGKISVGKNGMLFSKQRELFICRHGHINEKEKEFCEICGENIKGLQKKHLKKIDILSKKIEILNYLFLR